MVGRLHRTTKPHVLHPVPTFEPPVEDEDRLPVHRGDRAIVRDVPRSCRPVSRNARTVDGQRLAMLTC